MEYKKLHFKEEFNDSYYEFIETQELPEKDLLTCIFAYVYLKWKVYLTKNHRGWELPGGHIEKWENFDEALDRELSEEIWTTIKSKKLFGYKKYFNSEKIANRDWGFYPFPNSYILFYIAESTWEDKKIHCHDTIDYWLFNIEEALEKIDSKWTRKILEIMKHQNI